MVGSAQGATIVLDKHAIDSAAASQFETSFVAQVVHLAGQGIGPFGQPFAVERRDLQLECRCVRDLLRGHTRRLCRNALCGRPTSAVGTRDPSSCARSRKTKCCCSGVPYGSPHGFGPNTPLACAWQMCNQHIYPGRYFGGNRGSTRDLARNSRTGRNGARDVAESNGVPSPVNRVDPPYTRIERAGPPIRLRIRFRLP